MGNIGHNTRTIFIAFLSSDGTRLPLSRSRANMLRWCKSFFTSVPWFTHQRAVVQISSSVTPLPAQPCRVWITRSDGHTSLMTTIQMLRRFCLHFLWSVRKDCQDVLVSHGSRLYIHYIICSESILCSRSYSLELSWCTHPFNWYVLDI